MRKLFVFLLFFPMLSFANNSWFVSIPKYRINPSAPQTKQFEYTSVLYLTEQGLKSREPLNVNCSGGCWVGINTQTLSRGPGDVRYLDPEQENIYFKGRTVGDALTAMYERFGSYYYVNQATAPNRINEGIVWCGAIGISESGKDMSYKIMSGGECSSLPNPPDVECSLQTSGVDLNHSELIVDEVAGNAVSGEFIVRCNQNAQMYLSLMSPSEENSNPNIGTKVRLREKNELYSILTINGKPAVNRTLFNLSANDNRFTVTSTLFTPTGQVEPGPFSAFAYVIISYV
ncbi:PapG chaperone-binding domain-containing protein [Proteus mirabilis]|nr:hypothetical protein [Proteus mirabilis]HEK0657576.1 hypothetical protein [Proteus mirabilis]HEK2073042.1 hypothetical protein [Proteus mirabilis]